MVPSLFTIELVPGKLTHWQVDDRRVLRLWGPRVGPTCLALLNVFHDQFVALGATPGAARASHTMRLDYAAQCVGTSPSRAYSSIHRLERAGLLAKELGYDCPRWSMPTTVRPLTVEEWRRLPDAVRELNPEYSAVTP